VLGASILAAPEASSDDASSDDASSDDAASDVASDDFDSVVESSLSPHATSDNPIASANERANAFLIFLTKKPSF